MTLRGDSIAQDFVDVVENYVTRTYATRGVEEQG